VPDGRNSGSPLPEHPELRQLAEAMATAGVAGEILDHRFRFVYMSPELVRMAADDPAEMLRFYGESSITRNVEGAELFRVTEEGAVAWWELNAPIMRHYLSPGDEDFEHVFGRLAGYAASVEPAPAAPRAWTYEAEYPEDLRFRRSILGDLTWIEFRISDDAGDFIGVVRLVHSAVPDSLLARLGRGDRGLFERMDRVSEPRRRPAGILYADLEASGVLSRRLSSRGYFEVVRSLTDLLDSSVIAHGGIVGKHVGDGGSALFVAADFDDSESRAARATIEAARAIRAGAERLGPDDVAVRINIGVHWGATLMIGQVATSGRLEVTALGDQMNEGARIEAAATGGAILASKDLVERLDPDDAAAVGVDPDGIAYTLLGELDGVGDKVIRDAGAIPVAEI
jgi:class 3 adenylate cyclase